MSGNVILYSNKGRNTVINLRKNTRNNLNLDLVNVIAYIKFGEIMSISSQDIERKRKSDTNQGP